MKKFYIKTDGGTEIEMVVGTTIVVEIDGIKYEITIKQN